jgi:hypothetical protein
MRRQLSTHLTPDFPDLALPFSVQGQLSLSTMLHNLHIYIPLLGSMVYLFPYILSWV